MPSYKAPIEDISFLLNDVFHIDRYSALSGFGDMSPEMIEAILGEAAKICEEQLQPLNWYELTGSGPFSLMLTLYDSSSPTGAMPGSFVLPAIERERCA